DRRGLPGSRAPLYAGPDLRRAGARCRSRRPYPHRADRRRAQPDQSTGRLPLPPALPFRAGPLPARATRVARDRPQPHGRLSLPPGLVNLRIAPALLGLVEIAEQLDLGPLVAEVGVEELLAEPLLRSRGCRQEVERLAKRMRELAADAVL